ncbi:MAG: 4-hydroxybenzoate decarboxylase [Planctomycetota bacterium]|nr:MAG: 4-hydroxybenzoate decarboxylase [Planctomycetota bacterium]
MTARQPLDPPTGLLDLRALLDLFRSEGELVEIEAPVDPDLEAAELHRRVIAAGGPALLFKRIKGSDWPLVTNLFGSARRVELAFGRRPEQLVARIASFPHKLMPPSLGKLWQQRDALFSLTKVGRKLRRRGAVTEVVDSPARLGRLPLLRTWEKDGGPFVTLPLVWTEHPEGLGSNLGMYRIQRFDDETCGLHMQIGKGGGFHLQRYEELGQPMPVNVHIGGPPGMILSAIAPLPENVPEILLASLMLGQRFPFAQNPAGPMPVAAASEFVIVGKVQAGARHPEGPFGDHYGYYSLKHEYPRLDVDALLHRRNPICTATVVGKPRQEDFFIGDYLQELLDPLIHVVMPAVKQLWSYGETGYHSLAAAVVEERYKREAMTQAFRILGEGQLALTKFLLLTDQDVELKDFASTLSHVLARCRFESDLYIFGDLSMDTLDYTGPKVNEGSKGVLLGLGDPIRELPPKFENASLPQGFRKALPFCPGCLVVEGPSYAAEPEACQRLAQHPALEPWPLMVLVDDAERSAKSAMNFLWVTFTRFEPAADIHARSIRIIANRASHTPPIVIDARMRPEYPEELFCDPETAKTVSQRWSEYFPQGGIEMGDSDAGHLD